MLVKHSLLPITICLNILLRWQEKNFVSAVRGLRVSDAHMVYDSLFLAVK